MDKDILLDALLDNSTDLIYFKDTRGRFIRASRSMAVRFGLSDPELLIGKTDHDYYTKEHAEQAAKDEAQVIRTRQPIQGQVEKETWPDGNVTWVSTSKLPLIDRAGNMVGIHGISRDVTIEYETAESLKSMTRVLRERNEALENDLVLAGEVFEMFGAATPESLPAGTPADAAPVRCAFCYRPAAKLGGDFYLVLPRRGGHTRVMICDVMGHGVQAALVAILLRAWAQSISYECHTLGSWLERINSRLIETFNSKGVSFLATVLAIELDPASNVIQIASAGHPSPLLQSVAEGRVVNLLADDHIGPGLGIFPNASFHATEITWLPGDKLLMFTDGLSECRDAESIEFQDQQLLAVLNTSIELSAADLVKRLVHKAVAHRGNDQFDDDVCIVALERVG